GPSRHTASRSCRRGRPRIPHAGAWDRGCRPARTSVRPADRRRRRKSLGACRTYEAVARRVRCLTWCLTPPQCLYNQTCINTSRSDRTAEPRVNRIGHRRLRRLDGLVAPEEFVVFVVAAVPAAELGVVRDELNPFEPLHMS